jgi:hypothetical protein
MDKIVWGVKRLRMEGEERENVEAPEEVPRKRIDIRSALAVIPPASEVLKREKRQRERRLRLRFRNELKKDVAKLNPAVLKELGEGEFVEVVVAHRHRFRYKVEPDENVPENEVWVNGEDLPEYGIADNSIATVRVVQ